MQSVSSFDERELNLIQTESENAVTEFLDELRSIDPRNIDQRMLIFHHL